MPASNKIIPAMVGRNAKLIIFQDGQKRVFDFKSWSVKPNVTKHADGVNGEQRDRLDVTLNYYEVTGQMFMRDLDVLDAYLDAQAARDANTAPLDQAGAVRFEPNNGTRASYLLVDLLHDDFDMNQGGRSDKLMTNVSFRCGDLKKAKTI
ncbi:MAG TPA: hypothetical protein VF183_10190 [Acidimicrobiales bacterium]